MKHSTQRSITLPMRWYLFFVIFVIIYSFGLGQRPTVTIGVFDFEPLIRIKENGGVDGLFPRLLEYAAAKENWELKYKPGTLTEGITRLKNQEIDILVSVSKSEGDSSRFHFTTETVISTWAQIYTRGSSSFNTIVDLRNREVGVVKEAEYNRRLREILKSFGVECTFVELDSPASVLEAIDLGYVEAGAVDRLYGILHEKEYDVKRTSVVFSPVELHFAVLQGQNQKLTDALDYHLHHLKDDPDSIYYQTVNQTLGIKEKSPVVYKFLVWGLSIAVGLVILFGGINIILRRQVEVKTQEVRASEEKFRIISEKSSMPIAILQDNRLVYVNQAFADMSEFTIQEILRGKPGRYSEQLHPDDKDFVIEQLQNVQASETEEVEHHYSYRFYSKSGKLKWLEHYSRTITFNDRSANLVTLLDITGLKEAQQDIVAEKERLMVMVRSIGDGVITTDEKGNVVLMNPRAEDITGFTHEEALGLPVTNVFKVKDERSGQPLPNPVHEVIKRKIQVNQSMDAVLCEKDGAERIVLFGCAPILDGSGQMLGAVLVFHDITEKRIMERELLKNQKIESIGLLAGGIAHDFNNMLTVITGNIGLAKLSIEPEDKLYRYLDNAEKGAFNAVNLSQQLLTFSRGGDPVKETWSIGEIIKDSAVFALRGSASRCEFRLGDGLPPVDVDKGQIGQVLQNLIINADQAMPMGGIITIETKKWECASDALPSLPPLPYVEISVNDQGIGIQKEFLDRVFDPFFTTKQKGNGLGLSIVYSIIRKHGGQITVDSEQGKGTTFHIYLPASKSAKIKTGNSGLTTPKTGEGRILVMDDNEYILELLESMLTSFGYQVEEAMDGEEAIRKYNGALLSGLPFDLVIMDLTISGGMGGKEAIKKLREIDPGIKAIVSSGYANDPVVSNYRDYGFGAAVNKPFNVNQLSRKVHELLQ